MNVKCMSCGHRREGLERLCPECGHPFEIIPDGKFNDTVTKNFNYIKEWVSLGETTTPLIKFDKVSFKLDYFQPTFSYKDRGSRVAISFLLKYLKKGEITEINEDSSGNAGASIAAYGVAAGFRVNIFVPDDANPIKLYQIREYSANVIKIPGGRNAVAEAASQHVGFHLSHVLFPEFRDGIRTLAYEIFNQFSGKLPDRVFIPISAGSLFLGLYSGFQHLVDSSEIDEIPEIIGVQPQLISPICSSVNDTNWINNGDTSIADALVTRNSPLAPFVINRLRKHGHCVSVSEEEIIGAREELARKGILTEYSSATVYAAFKKRPYDGKNLLILTGNGLKNAVPLPVEKKTEKDVQD